MKLAWCRQWEMTSNVANWTVCAITERSSCSAPTDCCPEECGYSGLRLKAIEKAFADEERVEVKTYDCLTMDFAKEVGAGILLRGVRSTKDFEYERDIADMNFRLGGIETVLLISEPEYSAISSSVVRELITYGKDVSELLP